MSSPETKSLAKYIEHTNLKPTVSQQEIEQLVTEAIEHGFLGVCVPPYWVKKVRRDLPEGGPLLITVAGFPLAYSLSEVKALEVAKALEHGANEVDMVLNLTAIKSGATHWAKAEVAQLSKMAHQNGAVLKVILETAYLSDEEIALCARLCTDAGADFLKTSTGFAPQGATVEHIRLLRSLAPETVGLKASGGIKTAGQALALIAAGADRIGTSSGVAMMTNPA